MLQLHSIKQETAHSLPDKILFLLFAGLAPLSPQLLKLLLGEL